jgi:glycosyltransferase involved in cell wall biosynthesis
MPKISVILPVYNGLPYLELAIKSILVQTFQDFELIIIDDGSIDESTSVIESFNDLRIRFVRQQNHGLAATLNKAIVLAKGEYIARQDQDDICLPLRMQRQVEFLNANPEVGMVGTAAEIWVGNERTSRLLAHPADDAALRFGLLFDNYFVHSSVMIRRSVFDKVGAYSEDRTRQPPEDYELWSRVIREYKVANLPEVLMAYREVPGSMSRAGINPFIKNLVKISAENIAWAADCAADAPEVVAISKLMHGDYVAVPNGVRFAAMRAVLDRAVQKIAGASLTVPAELMLSLRRKENRLRYRYVDYHCGGLIGKALNGRVGRYAKNLARKLLRSRR